MSASHHRHRPITFDEKEISPYTNAGLAHDLGEEPSSNVLASTDGGKTFERIGQVRIPGTRVDEHMIVERRDGSLWMLVRNTGGIAQSSSSFAMTHRTAVVPT